MPIEIRELVIRATVVPQEEENKKLGTVVEQQAKEDMVAECVEQVLEILRREQER
jgi:hypothetical protein